MTDKPKRPMSAYMLWLNSAREQIKSDNPGLKVTEIAKKGGEIWRGMKDKSVSILPHKFPLSSLIDIFTLLIIGLFRNGKKRRRKPRNSTQRILNPSMRTEGEARAAAPRRRKSEGRRERRQPLL